MLMEGQAGVIAAVVTVCMLKGPEKPEEDKAAGG